MKRFLLVVTCLVCAFAIASPASAALLGTEYLIGYVDPGSPASPAHELVYANNLINWYNSDISDPSNGYTYTLAPGSNVPAPDLPLATGGVHFETLPVNTSSSTYLLAKFGNSSALYWLDAISPVSAITSPFGGGGGVPRGGGLSHVTLFGPTQVPEGATLMLLGFGLAGVGAFRRFMKR